MKVCWNAIVKNEADRIVRCMKSLIDHVDCAVIYDTGSTDGTPDLIEEFFSQYDKPVEVVLGTFENFQQARNEALSLARSSHEEWDYALLLDADMELRMQRDWPSVQGAAYQIMQKAGALDYYNTRLLRRDSNATYVGVTHEFLSVPEGIGTIRPDELYCIDHFDGANRTDKFERDIRLLEDAIRKEPNDPRSHFYLAQSYRDNGEWYQAAWHYAKRAEMGGWDEEVWNAQLNYAHCQKEMGKLGDYVLGMLKAHEMRPTRAEALYELAKFYRERGDNNVTTMFARQAARIKKPDDVLFVNNFVYAAGIKEELSIAAYYDPATRADGFSACDSLALGTHGYSGSTQLARANLFHYLPLAREAMPSFWAKELRHPLLPKDWATLNPSVVRKDKKMFVNIRTVNYVIKEDGSYAIRGEDGSITRENPIRTRNFICPLTDALQLGVPLEVLLSDGQVSYDLVRGYEDLRLFHCNGDMYGVANVRQWNAAGRCQQVMARLVEVGDHWGTPEVTIMPSHQEHEKNWMPVMNGGPKFVYQLGKVATPGGRIIEKGCNVNPEHIRGGSQVIPFRSGYLALVHEASCKPGGGYVQRFYWHRWVFFDVDLNVVKVSKPFVFHDKQIEFAAGLCAHPDGKRLVISYGVKDSSAWLAVVDANDVADLVFA